MIANLQIKYLNRPIRCLLKSIKNLSQYQNYHYGLIINGIQRMQNRGFIRNTLGIFLLQVGRF